METNEPLIRQHGGYRNLMSFQLARLVYDVTVRFCDRFVDKRSRTHDQMVQAARSGAQNIAEGSKVSGTSAKSELRLTNVARASLEELRLDYEDYLRHSNLTLWSKSDPRRAELVALRCTTADEVADWVGRTCSTDSSAAKKPGPTTDEAAANGTHVLIGVACALLGRQIAAQSDAFERDGGFTERLYRTRYKRRRDGEGR